jgi:hypothetical protein
MAVDRVRDTTNAVLRRYSTHKNSESQRHYNGINYVVALLRKTFMAIPVSIILLSALQQEIRVR